MRPGRGFSLPTKPPLVYFTTLKNGFGFPHLGIAGPSSAARNPKLRSNQGQ